MAKASFDDFRRKVEADMREWAAAAGLSLDALIGLAESTRRFLDKAGADLLSHGAPKPPPEQKPVPRVSIHIGTKPRSAAPTPRVAAKDVLLEIVREAGKEMRVLDVQRAAEERGLHLTGKQVSVILFRAAERKSIASRKPGKNWLYRALPSNGAAQLPLADAEQEEAADS